MVEEQQMECRCGCGELVSDGSFKPGHELEHNTKCDKEVDDVFKRIDDDQGEYDKQLLTLSSGFLAVSLAFIKDVVPLKDAEYLFLLYSSFALLASCIILVLFSYQFSISGQLKAKDYWENERNHGTPQAFPHWHAECIKWLNRFSGVFFGIGVLLVVFFVILNIKSEAKMAMANDGALIKAPANGSREERGSQIKAPAKPAPAPPSASNANGKNQSTKP
jgi:hypothetical protein